MEKLTKEQMLQKRKEKLIKIIKNEKNLIVRNIYKSCFDFV